MKELIESVGYRMINSDERILRFTVMQDNAGKSLSGFLSSRFPYRTSAEWDALIGSGAVLLNGAVSTADHILAEGNSIHFRPANVPEPWVDTEVTVVFEDEDIIVINKTGNLPVHPSGRYFNHTLWKILKDRFNVAEPIIINRLDRETSGITLIAKNPQAAKICRQQFNARSVTKKYMVLTEGTFQGSIHSRGYVGRDTSSLVRKKQRFEPSDSLRPVSERKAKWSDTLFTIKQQLNGISIITAMPHTGRLHQIRATLAYLGYPVVGDKMYGLDEGIFLRFCEDAMTPEDISKMRMKRQALHASSLTIRHTISSHPMVLTASLPPDMQELINTYSTSRR